jgi:hypothetical protein
MRIGTQVIGLICWAIASQTGRAEAAELTPGAARSSPRPSPVTLPPLPRSPIDEFRLLLALDSEELGRTLAKKTEAEQKFLNAKLAEYNALTREERELRLRATELRWYLRPLMSLAPANRSERLATVPDDYRALLEQRLKQWDLLLPDVQKEFLENEWTIHYFLRLESSTGAAQNAMMNDFSPERRQRLEAELSRWRALPQERRQRMCDHFQQFFELSSRDKEKTLGVLSDAERREMEKTLRAFEQLPPDQRRLCLNSFRKFANMTAEEQIQFLKNVDRWKTMTLSERATWRSLVDRLPPLPPGFGQPPLPPGFPRQINTSSPLPSPRSLGTNAGG